MEDSAPTWAPSNPGACCLPHSWLAGGRWSSPRPPSEGRPLRAGCCAEAGSCLLRGGTLHLGLQAVAETGVLPKLGSAAGTCA